MRTFLVFLAISFSVPSAAFTARWVSVTKNDKRTYYVDLDAVVFDGLVRTIWLKTVLVQPSVKGEAFRVEKWMHDCENDRTKLLAITVYKANGQVIGSGEAPHYTQDWQAPSADSQTTIIHRKVCGPLENPSEKLDTPLTSESKS